MQRFSKGAVLWMYRWMHVKIITLCLEEERIKFSQLKQYLVLLLLVQFLHCIREVTTEAN